MKENSSGSALLALLFVIVLLSSLLFLLLQTTLLQKRTAHSLVVEEQAQLAAQSGLSIAMNQLYIATSNQPSFLVGATTIEEGSAPVLVIGTTDLTNTEQLTPLISGNFSLEIKDKFKKQEVVDLNKNHAIAATGSYLAPWVTITNSSNQNIARYAYIFLDEQARLNPRIHQDKPRNDPDTWNQGAASIPLCLGTNETLLSEQETEQALTLASDPFLTLGSLEPIFSSFEEYDKKKIFLTSDETAIPDIIPSSLPEGGHPKYDLNDLATNPVFGATPSTRASNIATIIDRNLPLFKQRDPSLINTRPVDQCRYLNRLAACIVDYIDPNNPSLFINEGEPAGRGCFPLVTQTAERCHIRQRTSNSVTIENQYFIQVWNPYTKAIPAGSKATFSVNNRQSLHFGTATPDPFCDYLQTNFSTPRIGPNQSVVLSFPSVSQTWISPTPVPDSEFPSWKKAPEGNANPTLHQAFTFFWNDQLVDMSRRLPIGPGLCDGGLDHNEETLTNNENFWQCDFIPTEQDHAGNFRFVGDPRENYLSNYLWKTLSGQKSYLETCWQGIMTSGSVERLFSPATSWIHRDFIPVNPLGGNKPASLEITPDQIPSPYREEVDGMMAPLVLRNGPMNSIVELGNINDPAQADDLGAAPLAGSSDRKSSIYASGGGRTLRIGQPEFPYWDTPGKSAIELVDLFSVASTNNNSEMIVKNVTNGTNNSVIYRKGLINVNTAPHEVLTALFYGIMPTSDRRYTNSIIAFDMANQLATLLEKNRPYQKLSDLKILTPLLANANSYEPSLSTNVTTAGGMPLAAVFDRAREEAFGKMIHLCTIQSRAFRVYIVGQSLDPGGKPLGEAMMEVTLALLPNERNKKNYSSSDTNTPLLLSRVMQQRWVE